MEEQTEVQIIQPICTVLFLNDFVSQFDGVYLWNYTIN